MIVYRVDVTLSRWRSSGSAAYHLRWMLDHLVSCVRLRCASQVICICGPSLNTWPLRWFAWSSVWPSGGRRCLGSVRRATSLGRFGSLYRSFDRLPWLQPLARDHDPYRQTVLCLPDLICCWLVCIVFTELPRLVRMSFSFVGDHPPLRAWAHSSWFVNLVLPRLLAPLLRLSLAAITLECTINDPKPHKYFFEFFDVVGRLQVIYSFFRSSRHPCRR